MEYNSGSNRAGNFKSAKRVARGRFEITSTITSELYDTNSSYQLIVSITKSEIRKSACPSGIYFNYQFCKQWRNSYEN